MFISPAYAQSGAAGAAGGFASFLPLFFIILIFYFLVLRPMNKRAREHEGMTSGLRRGDKVVTGGGIVATVIRANEGEEEITVELAEGMRVKVLRSTISTRLEAAPEKSESGKKDKKDKKAA